MSTIMSFIKKHPVLTYFALTFTISWGSVLLVIGGPSKMLVTREQIETLLPILILTMLAGPTVAGLVLTGLIDGRAGFRELRSRLLRWRVGAFWYAVALLTSPLLATAILLILLPSSPVFLPGIFASDDKTTFLLLGITSGLVVGFFEELGWTGFATPRLRLRFGVLATGLILGFLWGAWHSFLAFCGNSTSSGALSLALFLPEFLYYVTVLPAYRVLMVLIYDRTSSLFVAVLMHASLTASVPFILMPLGISGVSLMTWYILLATALWVFVAVVQRRAQTLPQQTREPLPG